MSKTKTYNRPWLAIGVLLLLSFIGYVIGGQTAYAASCVRPTNSTTNLELQST